MPKKNHNFQYLSLVRYKGLRSILKNYEKYNVSIILDLEDSAQDLFDKKKTRELKRIAREGLIDLAEKKLNIKNKIYVRINKIRSTEFKMDLKSLDLAKKKGLKISGVFLPKVESFEDISSIHNALSDKKIKIVPIIESKKGILNIENILAKDKQKIISHIHYGHFDYCLDLKIWPFPEPYHQEYWKIIDPIIKVLKKFKTDFIQTPFPLIKNYSLFWSMVKYLEQRYKLKSTFCSIVNYDKNFMVRPKKIKNLRLKKISNNKKHKTIFANKIFKEYLESKSTKKSFSLSKKRFIAPHQFLMAREFLKK